MAGVIEISLPSSRKPPIAAPFAPRRSVRHGPERGGNAAISLA
jgi:hypothetical protein